MQDKILENEKKDDGHARQHGRIIQNANRSPM